MKTMTLRASGWQEYARLQSKTDPGKTYRVDKHDDNGAFRCQCKGFIFSKQYTLMAGREQKVCKHLAWMFAADAQAVRMPATVAPAPNVMLDKAAVMLTEVLRAGNLYANAAASTKMALVLAEKLAEFTPPVVAAPRPAAVPARGVRLIVFDD